MNVLAGLVLLSGLLFGVECLTYMGCYKDPSPNARLLSGQKKVFQQTLTIRICQDHCRGQGFRYAGVEWKFECFCSNDRPGFTYMTEEKECNQKCDGDGSEVCGGNLRINVYDLGGGEGQNFVAENYIGCFRDSKEQRMLTSARRDSEFQTPEYCTGYCYMHGFRFAGVQYGTECFCGDTLRQEAKVNSATCATNCAGDSAVKCGGNWLLSIYHTGIPDLPSDDNYLGCFKDDVKNVRLLSGMKMDLKKSNSPRRCMNICLAAGFKFSGVEYGVECFCGSRKPPVEKEVEERECHMACPVGEEFCGGTWRLHVHSTGSGKVKPVIPEQSTIRPTAKPIKVPTSSVVHTTRKPTVATRKPTRRPICDPSLSTFNGKSTCKGQILFIEEFRTPNLDLQKWSHEVYMPFYPDYEFVTLTSDEKNSYIKGGKLYIKPIVQNDTFVRHGKVELADCTGQQYSQECQRQAVTFTILPPVTSARINTKDYFSFRYGTLQIRAKLPVGDWIIPELWLKPKRKTYGLGYASGRIRVGLARGNPRLLSEGLDIGVSHLESGVLMGVEENVLGKTVKREAPGGWHQQFHNFTFVWTPDNLAFAVDAEAEEYLISHGSESMCHVVGFSNEECQTWNTGSIIAPFDKEFYISVGLTVGGMRDFPDGSQSGNAAKPWKNEAAKAMANFWTGKHHWEGTWRGENTALQIDYIKVTALH